MHKTTIALTAAAALALVACGGGGGGGGGDGGGGGPALGDDARRMVLADIADNIILPALRDFADRAEALETAVAAHAAAEGADPEALSAAQNAFRDTVDSLERVEVLQLGPAARSGTNDPQPGAMDIRDQIYAYPERVLFQIDCRALSGADVDASTRIDAKGFGALEHLLFNEVDADAANNASCTDGSVDVDQARAAYASRVADFMAQQATRLRQEWEREGDDFAGDFASAGAGSMVYDRPQDALDALSLALFYVEKESKDRKVACPTGIGASGLSCPEPDVSRAEFPFAQQSGPALLANLAVFRDVFTGADGGEGLNALLEGIGRQDIANDLSNAVEAAISLGQRIESEGGFEAAIQDIDSSSACNNASSVALNPEQEPVAPLACAMHGRLKAVTDIFRGDVVGALDLAVPQGAAADND
jgi:predicted lipoprotein